MAEPAALTLSRLIRDSADILLPLTSAGSDVVVDRVEFDIDVDRTSAPDLRGAVLLVTEAVPSPTTLARVLEDCRTAAALVMAPGTHEHLGVGGLDAHERGPLVLERTGRVTWAEVLVHLRQLTEGGSSALTWPDADDLNSLAAVIADTTGASITIEDPASRVLAHANLGEDLDEIRKQTILTGAIPEWRIAQLEESGFLPAVRTATDVVERPATASDPARSVIALRSDGELLGTIWAAYPAEVDPGTVREILREAARAAVPVMLRTLRRSPFDARIRSEALGSILAGSTDLAPAATLLSLPFAGHYTAVALADVTADTEALLRFHLRAAFADVIVARDIPARDIPARDIAARDARARDFVGGDASGQGVTGPRIAILLHTSAESDEAGIRTLLVDTLERTMPQGEPITIGIGSCARQLDHIHASWTEACYVLDALESALTADALESALTADAVGDPTSNDATSDNPASNEPASLSSGGGAVRAAIAAELPAELVGLEIADALAHADLRITEPAGILATHDAAHQTQLLRTLATYFETIGNSAEAARRLHVHVNSLRHRLARIEELTGLSPLRRADRLWLEISVLVHLRERRRDGGPVV